MASFIFPSAMSSALRAEINFEQDSFKAMLLVPKQAPPMTARSRAEIQDAEIQGQGYTPGGAAVLVSVRDDGPVEIILGGHTWDLVGDYQVARALYYRDGGAPEDDLLVACLDYGYLELHTGDFTLEPSRMRVHNGY